VIEPQRRRVLDRPVKPGDDSESATFQFPHSGVISHGSQRR
jgi:hypothetical protein